MRKEDVIEGLNKVEDLSSKIRKEIFKISTRNINKKEIKDSTKELCKYWFEEIEPPLQRFGISEDVTRKYHGLFTNLLELSLKSSRRETYLKKFDDIQFSFKEDLHIPVIKWVGSIISIGHLAKILENASEQEKDYLNEALGCAGHKFFRASIVLGWSAVIHRLHKTVEKLGFDEFNKKSEEMKILTEGRFKRFNKSFHVQSLSDLSATIFDNDLLWVLEYWELLDSNQHERLSICFTMRNNAAHPGEASITEENLASFYSDLKTIIFENPKFKS